MGDGEFADLDPGDYPGDRIVCLGNQAYYWSVGGGFANEVVISAHGGIKSSAVKDLLVPTNVTLQYYVDHGKTQDDFGVDRFFYQKWQPACVETVGNGQLTYNYQLTKYQGRHAGTPGKPKETYKSIQVSGDLVKRMMTEPASAAIMQPKPVDVVSIRNRWFSSGLDLKKVLEQVTKIRSSNIIVHCFFCRSLY